VVLLTCFYPYKKVSKQIIALTSLSSHTGSQPRVDKRHASSALTRSLNDKRGRRNPRRLTPSSSSQQFKDSRANEEGYSRQIRGFKQFHPANRTRKKTQGGIQGAQQPRQKAKQKPVVHSDQAIEGGQIQLTFSLYFILFIVCVI
jgi:hypothetical protein